MGNRNIRIAQRRRFAKRALRELIAAPPPKPAKRISAIEVLRPLSAEIVAAHEAGWPVAKIAEKIAPHLQVKSGSAKAAIREILGGEVA